MKPLEQRVNEKMGALCGALQKLKIRPKTCECSDPGCPVHPGKSECGNRAKTILVRSDMEDRTGTAFCAECASDALDSGLFNESVRLKIKAGL